MYKIIGLFFLIYFFSSKLLQNKKNLENLHVKNNILTEQLKKKELEIKAEKMKNAKLLENETIKEVETKREIQKLEKERDFLITELELVKQEVKQEENKILQSNKLSQLIYEYYYVGVGLLSLLLLFYLYGIFKIQSKTKQLSKRQQKIKQNQTSVYQTKKTIQDEKNKTLVLNNQLEKKIRKAKKEKKDLQDYLKAHKQVSAQQTKKINQFLKGTELSRKRVLNALNYIQRSNNPLGRKKSDTRYPHYDDTEDYIFNSNNDNDNNNDNYYRQYMSMG